MLCSMSNDAKSSSFSNSILGLLKKHWLPLIVAIIAIVFIALNRVQAQVNFLFFRVDTALWLALSVAAILRPDSRLVHQPEVVGASASRLRVKRTSAPSRRTSTGVNRCAWASVATVGSSTAAAPAPRIVGAR